MTTSPEWTAADVGGRRVPDFFIVGHPKCGTTALHEMLRRQPQVFMPSLKEPRFLAGDVYVRPEHAREDGLPRTLDEYLALFARARADQRVGEASPLYLMSSVAAGRIAELQPDARIVAVLREPASFLRSLHLQFVESRIEDRNDLREAISLEDERRAGRRVPSSSQLRPHVLWYADHVRYVEQLRRYEEVFGRERMLVLIYDDLRADNEQAVRSVLAHVDLAPAQAIEQIDANPTVGVRSQRLDGLLHGVSVGRRPATKAAQSAVKALLPRSARRGVLRAAQRRLVYREPPPPDERLMAELRVRFKDEVVALGEHLDRDLVELWGYRDVG